MWLLGLKGLVRIDKKNKQKKKINILVERPIIIIGLSTRMFIAVIKRL